MKIQVKVKAKSRAERVVKAGSASYKVWVNAAPENGKANAAVVEILSEYFSVPKKCVSIVSGHTASNKIVLIDRP